MISRRLFRIAPKLPGVQAFLCGGMEASLAEPDSKAAVYNIKYSVTCNVGDAGRKILPDQSLPLSLSHFKTFRKRMGHFIFPDAEIKKPSIDDVATLIKSGKAKNVRKGN